MRARILLLSLAAAALLLPSTPASASDAPSRRRPRVTRPSADTAAETDELPPPKPRKSRRNAIPIDGEAPAPEEPTQAKPAVRFSDDDEAPPPPKRAKPATEEFAPASDDASFDDEERPRRRRSTSDDDELRRSADHDEDRPRSRPRGSRTAEEELGDGIPEIDERLSGLDEPGNGLGAELQTGVMWLDYATGGTKSRFTIGLNFTWQLGRLFAPENELLHNGLYLEGSYLYASLTEGTKAVEVGSSYHFLSAAVLAGYPFTNVLVYGKFGPAMAIMPVEYVLRPADGSDGPESVTEFSGVKGGFVYGIGARAAVYTSDQLGVAGRLELIRYRRQYLDDTLLVLGVGAVF